MKNSAIINELENLGLGYHESVIYLLLIKQGSLRISQICKSTALPRSSVYEYIRNLSQAGLVQDRIDDSHHIIEAYSVTTLSHKFQEQIGDLEQKIVLAESLEDKLALLPGKAGNMDVKFYKDRSGARQLFWNTLKSQTEVYVYSAFGRSQFVGKQFYGSFVEESKRRGINERVLINPTRRALGLIQRDTGTALARTKTSNIRLLSRRHLAIEGETFIYDDVYAYVYLDGEQIGGFEIHSPNFTLMQRSAFELLWARARRFGGH